jgi:hypothetical protein
VLRLTQVISHFNTVGSIYSSSTNFLNQLKLSFYEEKPNDQNNEIFIEKRQADQFICLRPEIVLARKKSQNRLWGFYRDKKSNLKSTTNTNE